MQHPQWYTFHCRNCFDFNIHIDFVYTSISGLYPSCNVLCGLFYQVIKKKKKKKRTAVRRIFLWIDWLQFEAKTLGYGCSLASVALKNWFFLRSWRRNQLSTRLHLISSALLSTSQREWQCWVMGALIYWVRKVPLFVLLQQTRLFCLTSSLLLDPVDSSHVGTATHFDENSHAQKHGVILVGPLLGVGWWLYYYK